MNAKLYIAIPVHNRRPIVEQCVPTVLDTLDPADELAIYNDGSAELLPASIVGYTRFCHCDVSIGIERQRRLHFEDFWQRREDFTHLYLTDSDAPHDPTWRSELLRLQEKYGAPVCGYRTQAHARIPGNIVAVEPDVLWQRSAPGISMLLTRKHCETVMEWLRVNQQDDWSWDWQVSALVGPVAVTRQSVVDHIGRGGMHDPRDYEGYDGGDRATNPTPALVALRAAIVQRLQACPTPSSTSA